jgi:hypothetical protein
MRKKTNKKFIFSLIFQNISLKKIKKTKKNRRLFFELKKQD